MVSYLSANFLRRLRTYIVLILICLFTALVYNQSEDDLAADSQSFSLTHTTTLTLSDLIYRCNALDAPLPTSLICLSLLNLPPHSFSRMASTFHSIVAWVWKIHKHSPGWGLLEPPKEPNSSVPPQLVDFPSRPSHGYGGLSDLSIDELFIIIPL